MQIVKLLFNGTQDYVDTALPSAYNNDNLQVGVVSSDVPVRITLTNRTHYAVRVEPSARFTGTVLLSQTGDVPFAVPFVASRSTGSQGYVDGGSTPQRVTTIPIPVPTDIGAGCSVTFSNQSAASPNSPNGAAVSNFNVSVYAGTLSSGQPVPTGSSLATWTNQTIPGSGGTWTSPTTFDATGKASANYLIVVIGSPASTHFNVALGITEGEYVDGTSTTDPVPGGRSGSNNATGTCRIVGWTTAKHRVVVMGDSLANGYSATGYAPRREQSAFVKIGPDNNWAVDTLGIAGMTLAQGSSLVNYAASVVVNGAILWTNLSINSLPSWANLAAAQADYAAFVTWAQGLGFTKIVLSTLPPSVTYLANDTLRQSVNAWMLAGGISGVTAVVDIDLVVRDPAAHTQLLAAYALADGTHWNATGHAAVATAATTVLSPLF